MNALLPATPSVGSSSYVAQVTVLARIAGDPQVTRNLHKSQSGSAGGAGRQTLGPRAESRPPTQRLGSAPARVTNASVALPAPTVSSGVNYECALHI